MSILDDMLTPEAGSASQGYHAKIQLKFGYGFFAKGINAADVFVEFTPGDTEGKDKAKALATKASAEYGKQASKGILLVIPAETVKVRTLRADMKKVTLQWNEKSYAKWMDSLKVAGVSKTGSMWAHVAAIPDPDGQTQVQTRDGKEVTTPQTFWYIEHVYDTEAECEAAAKLVATVEATGAPAAGETPPTGYSAADWQKFKGEIITACGSFAPPLVKAASESYAIPVEYLMQFKPK